MAAVPALTVELPTDIGRFIFETAAALVHHHRKEITRFLLISKEVNEWITSWLLQSFQIRRKRDLEHLFEVIRGRGRDYVGSRVLSLTITMPSHDSDPLENLVDAMFKILVHLTELNIYSQSPTYLIAWHKHRSSTQTLKRLDLGTPFNPFSFPKNGMTFSSVTHFTLYHVTSEERIILFENLRPSVFPELKLLSVHCLSLPQETTIRAWLNVLNSRVLLELCSYSISEREKIELMVENMMTERVRVRLHEIPV
ncbi:hypothetical protein DL96DRAFT_589485 [Flagelloscypha sp. PMI_526]|nr:hypothetical protein DL96DRAFT_589485 [Flagelloscypha sp. PMI_526]